MFLADMAIDISGSPKEDTYFGLFSINSAARPKFTVDFYKNFPKLKHSRWKGTKLGEKELLKIAKYFNENKARVYVTKFLKKDWKKWQQNLPSDEPFFNERIHAIMYYKIIKSSCWRGLKKEEQIYNISVDEETNVRMNPLIDTCIRLCKGGRINVSFNKTRAKYSEMIKFADYGAAIHRKVNEKNLKELKHFKIINNRIEYKEINKAFRLYKKRKLKNKFRKMYFSNK